MKKKKGYFILPNIVFILLFGLLIRLILHQKGTLLLDQNTFIAWSQRLATEGFKGFYEAWSDYLPGYLYVLWFLGKARQVISLPDVFLYKLPAILADLMTGWLIYLIVKKYKQEKTALIASSLYIFNPAIIANSTLWGQVDSLTALFSVLAVWLVSVQPLVSAVVLALGVTIKPQAALAAAVVLMIILKRKWKAGKIVGYILISLLVFTAVFIPFNGGGNLPAFIIERVAATLNQYQYTSVNAFNSWGLFGFWIPDDGLASLVGFGLTSLISLIVIIKGWKKKNRQYYLMAVLFTFSFLFFSRMHERHLLPAFAPLAIISGLTPVLWIPYVGLSITYLLNLYYAFNWITKDFLAVFPDAFIKLIILVNLGLLGILLKQAAFSKRSSNSLTAVFNQVKTFFKRKKGRVVRDFGFKPRKLSAPKVKIVLLVIISFSLLSRVAWLSKPENMYFDEVYHAFTAKLVLNNDPKAWEWWNPHPEGFAYEWTHPPLAKEGMALGMLVFGENSFGWRVPGAILGVGTVLLIYLIARELFKDEVVGLISSAVFALDGLPLVMSRIGMNDAYLLFFILLSLYLFLKEKNILSALAFGLALSSKWSAVWAVPIFLAVHFVLKRKLKVSHLSFLAFPPLVYLASYIPMFLTDHGFDIFIGVQKQMWWYHTGLEATHSYTSMWYSWPFLLRPIWLHVHSTAEGLVANIYAMGNPVVFWFGAAAILVTAYYALKERNRILGLIVFSYLIFFVPWAASPRIMFLYHYLPSLPFLAIASGYLVRRLPKLLLLLVIMVIVYLYFYPHWSGLPVSEALDNSYYWFNSWK